VAFGHGAGVRSRYGIQNSELDSAVHPVSKTMKTQLKKILPSLAIASLLFLPLAASAESVIGSVGNTSGTPAGSSGVAIYKSGLRYNNAIKQEFTVSSDFVPVVLRVPIWDQSSSSNITMKLCLVNAGSSTSDPCVTTLASGTYTTVSLPTSRADAFTSPTLLNIPVGVTLSASATYAVYITRDGSSSNFTRVAYTGSGFSSGTLYNQMNSCTGWDLGESTCGSTSYTGFDIFFGISGTFTSTGTYFPGPTATIYSPPNGTVVPSADVAAPSVGFEARAYSSASTTDSLGPVDFDWLLFRNGTLAGFKLDQIADTVYGTGSKQADTVHFIGLSGENGTYELRARACQGSYCGSYSNSYFTVVDSGTSSPEDSVFMIETFPQFACTGSGSGGSCTTFETIAYFFTGYIPSIFRWFFLPPGLGAFDATPLFDLFKSRWPINYITVTYDNWTAGFGGAVSCPLPSQSFSLFGATIPLLNICTTFASVGTAIDANAFASGVLVWLIYIGAVFAILFTTKKLIKQ